jgi:DNA polymerase
MVVTTTKIDPTRAVKQHLELMRNMGIREIFKEKPAPDAKLAQLDALRENCAGCQKCALHNGRIKSVFGEGDPNAGLMFIGEGPGAEENQTGRPFVGAAGQLLDKILLAMNLKRSEVYIANIVKCRPPGNRDPEQEERIACLPYLLEQISIIRPKALILLGAVAAQTILQRKDTLTQMRGGPHYFMDIPTFVTYHPAALLRNPHWKAPTWEDLQKFMAFYASL